MNKGLEQRIAKINREIDDLKWFTQNGRMESRREYKAKIKELKIKKKELLEKAYADIWEK